MNSRRISSLLHGLAAVVLLLFAVSHFADLIVGDVSHDLDNTVFPFFTNRVVYGLASLLELVLGLLCWRFRGREQMNVGIWAFIGLMLWYHWAFNFTGGTRCGCAGILGKLLHLSRTQERAVPLLALVVLAVATTPWLGRLFLGIGRRLFRSAGALPGDIPRSGGGTPPEAAGGTLASQRRCPAPSSRGLPLVLLLLAGNAGRSEPIIEIRGEDDAARYNPRTERVYTNTQVRVGFVATLCGAAWRICATNLNHPAAWAELVWDGTNTYNLVPAGSQPHQGKPPQSNLVEATVWPSPFYHTGTEDTLGISLPWLAYGFSPRLVGSNHLGLVEIPLPWQQCRHSPHAYGYKWLIDPPARDRFLKRCSVVRAKALDLPDQQELLRFDMDYPDSVGERNLRRENIALRRQVPDGFVEASYVCTEWSRTNDLLIPVASEFRYYWPMEPSHPNYVGKLRAQTISLREGPQELLPRPNAPTLVEDYRYKRAHGARIFKFAQYTLQAADPWKTAADPALLAQVEYHLQHGRRYDDLVEWKRVLLTWAVLGGLSAAALGVLWGRESASGP